MIDVLFHVTHRDSARYLFPLIAAARRRGASIACFFTFDGVGVASDPGFKQAIGEGRAVMCEESWHRFHPGRPCPVEAGSQTVNSALMGEAKRVVSL